MVKFICKRWKEIIFVIFIIALVGGGAYFFLGQKKSEIGMLDSSTVEIQDITNSERFSGLIEANESRDIYALISYAKVKDVLVKNNDQVHAGDPLIILDDSEALLELKKDEADLIRAQNQRKFELANKELELAQHQEQIRASLNVSVLQAEQNFIKAQENYNETCEKYNELKKNLDNGTYATIVDLENQVSQLKNEHHFMSDSDDYEDQRAVLGQRISNAQRALETARIAASDELATLGRKIDEAEKDMNRAEETYEQALLASNQAEERYRLAINQAKDDSATKSAEVSVEKSTEKLGDYVVRAPIDGYVVDVAVKIGDTLENSKVLMKIQNFDVAKVKVKVDEYNLQYFDIGTPVSVYVRAFGESFDGVVTERAMTATQENDISFVDTTITFDSDQPISAGLGAEIEVVKETAEGVLAIPAAFVEYSDATYEPYVLIVDKNGKVVRQPIECGLESDDYIEIISGLSLGETVYWDQQAMYEY